MRRMLRARASVSWYPIGVVMLFGASFALLPLPAVAQESLSLTVTPPLFQVSLNPGEIWSTTVRVVNGGVVPVMLYADPVPFSPLGEAGRPRFDLTARAGEGSDDRELLADWIETLEAPLEVRGEQTVEVPITIRVPADASPGGHYAAVLIGNRAPEAQGESTVSVASSIATLFLVTVAGDIDERARIRDFVSDERLYEKPEARFSLRFENQGNVHLMPQGVITIYNMFGKERGRVTFNEGEHFGNVLPGSIRKFSFSWKADSGVWDIGRYRAEAVLGYGREAKRFTQATTYFYVLPILPLAGALGGTLCFVLLLLWGVRAYIRRALLLETAHLVDRPVAEPVSVPIVRAHIALEPRTLLRPISEGMVDLRRIARPTSMPEASNVPTEPVFGTIGFLTKYRYFFLFIALAGLGWVLISALLTDVLTYERSFEVSVDEAASEVHDLD